MPKRQEISTFTSQHNISINKSKAKHSENLLDILYYNRVVYINGNIMTVL